MKNHLLFGMIALTIGLSACHQTSKEDIESEWKSLDETVYSIEYPANFELDISGQMGTSFILLSELTSEGDLFRENINLLIQNLEGQDLTLDQYVDISIEQINSMITDGNIIENNRITDDHSEEHQEIIFTGKQGTLGLKWKQLYWIKNEHAYVLTLTCEEDQYDDYYPVCNKTIESFTIK